MNSPRDRATLRRPRADYFFILVLTLATTGLLMSACGGATGVRPGSGALQGPDGMVTQGQQVKLTVHTDAWSYVPRNLSDEVIPLEVTIENHSDVPLAVRYDAFRLARHDEPETLHVLPPRDINEDVTQNIDMARALDAYPYDHDGFLVYDELSGYYPTLTPVGGMPVTYGFNDGYYRTYYDPYYGYAPTAVEVELPTRDMLLRALPEGVIEPGGRVQGFIYVEELDDEDARLTFEYDLINAETGKRMGQLTLPLLGRD